MDALHEWDSHIRPGFMPTLSTEELIELGHKAAIAAPECRWEVMKNLAHGLYTYQRLPTLDTLDDYVALVIAVTHDCVAEQVLKETELHLIGLELDRRKRSLYRQITSNKNDSGKKKRQE